VIGGEPKRARGSLQCVSAIRYRPGLDGVRALAVIGVLLYHAQVAAVPGGFLGVDLFFVLSGFLITSLLLDDRLRTGTVHLASSG
jgi:peptidoglycan/LPS O-acetylase OafA/YrhL